MKPAPANDNPTANSEGERAQRWRRDIMGLSIKNLAELTGYSVTAIRCFEANANTAGELFGEDAWKRYRNTCAGILTQEQLRGFNWTQKANDLGVDHAIDRQR